MHCILESTFARIFLFLELPFLQEAQFSRKNLSQSSSLEEFPDLTAITVTFRRDHFMWGKHAALFWLGILNSARESIHPQCSKNKKIRAKVDSEGLYGRGRLLFMCSCTMYRDAMFVSLGGAQIWRPEASKNICRRVCYKKPVVVFWGVINIYMSTCSHTGTVQIAKSQLISHFL